MITVISSTIADQEDEEFVLQLYQGYNRLMYATARKYVSDPSACEDIVQDALVKLIEKKDLLRSRPGCILPTYIVSTIRNTSINYLKRSAHKNQKCISIDEDFFSEIDSDSLPLDELMCLKEQKAQLSQIWNYLSTNERILLEGKYILGYTDRELAKTLCCQPASVRMKLTRAKRKALNLLNSIGKDNKL